LPYTLVVDLSPVCVVGLFCPPVMP
jgi:hypothetical protein